MFNFFKRKERKNKFICPGAFSQVYIYPDGRVFLCPDCFMTKDAEIGNLNNSSFEQIYNSKRAREIRKSILNGEYYCCNPQSCYSKSNYNSYLIPQKGVDFKEVQKKFPKMVCIGADCECNVNCIMCRPDLSRLSDDELKQYNKKIDNLYMPILKDAEVLTLSNTADPLASRNTRLLMKTAAQKYPNLKFNILTNGILCDKHNCDDIGITDRLLNVMVSIHASEEETYNKIVKNGNFKKAEENIRWLASLKEEKKIENLYLAFVISSKNYENIPAFIEFAKNHNAVALFWGCVSWGDNLNNSDEPLDIANPNNPKFKKLMDLLNTINMESEYSHFSFQIRQLNQMYKQRFMRF